MEKQEALRILTAQIALIPSLTTKVRDSGEFTKWRRDTRVAIQNVFDNDIGHVQEFEAIEYGPRVFFTRATAERALDQGFREGLDNAASILKSMVDEVEQYWVEPTVPFIRWGEDVFVVHGHDDAAKEMVSRFIERLDLKAIILHEQPNAGRTLIEKFLAHSNVGFAVVLLTPDDVGEQKDKAAELKPRARQNVIFELGYFIGKLGRERVCPLYVEGVEIPSDYPVVYVPLDTAGGWRLELAKELKAAGLPIDMNKVIYGALH